jgi:hypothetical protein
LFPSPGFHRCCAACFINMHCTFRLPGSIHLQQAVRCCSGFSSEISSGFIYGETILRIFLHQTVAVMLFPKWAAEPCCQDSLRYFTYKLPCLWSAGRLYQDKFWFRPFATVPSALLLPTANLAICNSRLKHLSTGQPYTIYVKLSSQVLRPVVDCFFDFNCSKNVVTRELRFSEIQAAQQLSAFASGCSRSSIMFTSAKK